MDGEFLNTPIKNYQQMQIVFDSGIATIRFVMASLEPFGKSPLTRSETRST